VCLCGIHFEFGEMDLIKVEEDSYFEDYARPIY